MSEHEIVIDLSRRGVQDAIRQFAEYTKWVDGKCKQLSESLAKIGYSVASVRFDSAWYTGTNDVKVELQKNENVIGGFTIIAQGHAVCFIEFGAGVHYNGSDGYPGQRAAGVVGIGEYGMHHGRQDFWTYLDTDGQPQITHGTPAQAPMYYAVQEMQQKFLDIAKEVFGN